MPVHLNTAEFDKQVAMRGLTMPEFVRKAGLSVATIRRSRRGGAVRISTLSAVARAFVELKPMPGLEEMDLIVATSISVRAIHAASTGSWMPTTR